MITITKRETRGKSRENGRIKQKDEKRAKQRRQTREAHNDGNDERSFSQDLSVVSGWPQHIDLHLIMETRKRSAK